MAKKAKKRRVTVYACQIGHRHGTDVQLSWTARERTRQLYEYVCEWWSEWNFDEVCPKSMKKAIDIYFNSEVNEEWADFTEVKMPLKK